MYDDELTRDFGTAPFLIFASLCAMAGTMVYVLGTAIRF